MLLLSMLAASVPALLLYYPLNERNSIISTISIDAIQQVSLVVLLVKQVHHYLFYSLLTPFLTLGGNW